MRNYQRSPQRRHSTISSERRHSTISADEATRRFDRPLKRTTIKVLNAESVNSFNSEQQRRPSGSPEATSKIVGADCGGPSPQRSELSTFHHLRDESLGAIGNEFALDAFDSDDLELIPVQNFADIERQIGMTSTSRSPWRRNGRGPSLSASASVEHEQSTTASTLRVHTLPVIEESSLNTSAVTAELTEVEITSFCGLIIAVVRYLFCSQLIAPHNAFKLYWDRLIVAIVVYTALALPFQISFRSSFDRVVYLELIFSTVFALDIWVGVRTTFRSPTNGEYVVDAQYISSRYRRTWFLCDVLASIPVFEVLVFAEADYGWQLRLRRVDGAPLLYLSLERLRIPRRQRRPLRTSRRHRR